MRSIGLLSKLGIGRAAFTMARFTLAAALWAGIISFLAVVLLPAATSVEIRTVLTGSMKPSMAPGTLVIARPVRASDISVGDVIMFKQPDDQSRVITHRVVALPDGERKGFTTRGDANNSADPWELTSGDIVGSVVFDVPYAGQVAEWIRSPLGMLLLLILPCAWLLLSELRVVYRFIRYGAAGAEA